MNFIKFLKKNSHSLLIVFLLTILIALIIRNTFIRKNFRESFSEDILFNLNNAKFVEAPPLCTTIAAPTTTTEPQWRYVQTVNGTNFDYESFGHSVAISGTTIVIGAPWDRDHQDQGYVYVYYKDPDDGIWKRTWKNPSAQSINGIFGNSVSISNNTILVGAPLWDGITDDSRLQHTLNPNIDKGRVFWYDMNRCPFVQPNSDSRCTWIRSSDVEGNEGDKYGTSVSISGSVSVIGAPGYQSNSGQVRVYEKDNGNWIWKTSHTPNLPDYFYGHDVSTDGKTIVVSSNKADINWVRVFEKKEDGSWGSPSKPSDGKLVLGDGIGGTIKVAVHNSTIVVGAEDTGKAFVFTKDPNGGWGQTPVELTIDGELGANSRFGHSVAVYNSTIVVGADGVNNYKGAAYIYTKNSTSGVWENIATLNSTNANGAINNERSYYGSSVAINGTTIAIGVTGRTVNGRTDAGAVDIFEYK